MHEGASSIIATFSSLPERSGTTYNAKSDPHVELHTPLKQVFRKYLRRHSLDDASQQMAGMTVEYRHFGRVFPQKAQLSSRLALSSAQCFQRFVAKPFESQKPVHVDHLSPHIACQEFSHQLFQAFNPRCGHSQLPKLSF